jgi:hypothetical protein
MKTSLRCLIALTAICGAGGCSQQQQVQSAAVPLQLESATATEPSDTTQAAAAAPTSVPANGNSGAAQAGMKIYLDPATGQPRDPTPEEIEAMNRARVTAQSTTAAKDPDTVRTLPNGQLEFHVPSRGMHEIRVCRQADGSLSEDNCPPDAGSAPNAASSASAGSSNAAAAPAAGKRP